MKHTKKRNIPSRIETVVDYTTCDICGKRIENRHFEVDEIGVYHKTGNAYPEGGSGEKCEFDICGECFDSKVIPFLKSLGATPTVKEWDY